METNEENSRSKDPVVRPVVRLRRQNIPVEELIADLRRVSDALANKAISYDEYERLGKFAVKTITSRFGTWLSALERAGLETRFDPVESVEALFENLLNVWTTLGRQPTTRDMRKPVSRWGLKSYRNHFGTWNETLLAFARFVDAEIEDEPAILERVQGFGRRTPRCPNLRLRWKVLQRDFFRCKCGRSPATDPTVILHVDHILAWANGGETVLENLQTLCERCNLGKADG